MTLLAITCGKIFPVTSPAIENGVILVEDGKIKAVGPAAEVAIPEGAEILDASGRWVYPGFVEAASHIGANRQPSDFSESLTDGHHDGIDGSHPLLPHLRIRDSINPQDNTIKWVFGSGVTTAFVAAGPISLIDGAGVAIKIKAAETVDELLIEGSEQMCFTMGDEAMKAFKRKKQPPLTRMAAMDMLREALDGARDYGAKPADERKPDKKMEALLPVVNGEMTARFECLRADDIVAAVKLAEDYHLRYSIVGGFEGHLVKDFLARHHAPVIMEAVPFGPERCMPMIDLFDFSLETASVLEKGGNLAAITVNENGQTRRLPILAGFTTAYGVDEETALACITIRPAEQLGLADRIGSLEPGKDADIAIFDGNALSNMSLCKTVLVDGQIVYQG